ncbi:hypothetical protein KCP78_24040 [Salmonella enterica subsp. enterica]|nr:hypothetical protein KCP78_24040 [Salmonella enterica subsp. enterica]
MEDTNERKVQNAGGRRFYWSVKSPPAGTPAGAMFASGTGRSVLNLRIYLNE